MEKISVNTPLGILTACIGGDPECYPEIFVYLQREDGIEVDLVAADVNLEKRTANAYLYGDTSTDMLLAKTPAHICLNWPARGSAKRFPLSVLFAELKKM